MQYRIDAGGHATIEGDKLGALDAAVEAFTKACEDAGVVLKIDVQAIPQTEDENKQVMERSLQAEQKAEQKRKETADKFKIPHSMETHPSRENPKEQPRETHDKPSEQHEGRDRPRRL